MKKYFFILFLSLSTVLFAQNQPLSYRLFPNPMTSDNFEVTFTVQNKNSKNLDFTISNVLGQVVFNYHLTDDDIKKGSFSVKLDQLKLEKGFYLTKLTDGEHTNVQKLIVR